MAVRFNVKRVSNFQLKAKLPIWFLSNALLFCALSCKPKSAISVTHKSQPVVPSVTAVAKISVVEGSVYSFGPTLAENNYEKAFHLKNEAEATASDVSIHFSNADLSFKGGAFPGTGGTCGVNLAAGSSCSFVVVYKPSNKSAFQESFTVSYKSGNESKSFKVGITANTSIVMKKLAPSGTLKNRQLNTGLGTSVEVDGNTMAVSASNERAIYIYTKNISTWELAQKIAYPGKSSLLTFGVNMALKDNLLAIGDPGDSFDANNAGSSLMYSGAVFVYRKQASGAWEFEQKIVGGTSPRASLRFFGSDVATDGNILAIGVHGESNVLGLQYAGAAYIYKFENNKWEEDQKLTASTPVSTGRFGFKLALYDNTLAVSAIRPGNNGAGIVSVFTRFGSVWSLQQEVGYLDAAPEEFGLSLSLKGDTLAVGAQKNDTDATDGNSMSYSGAVFVYTRAAGVWGAPQKLVASDRSPNGRFGVSVDFDNETLVVGAALVGGTPAQVGTVYAFTRSGSVWSEQQKIVPTSLNGSNSGDLFGATSYLGEIGHHPRSLKLVGDSLYVGTPNHSFNAQGVNPVKGSGAVFTFLRSGNTWAETQKITIENTNVGDNKRLKNMKIGNVVAYDANTLAVGVPSYAFDETGNIGLENMGLVYLYERSGINWNLKQTLFAPITSKSTGFGNAISIHGNTIAIGASIESWEGDGNYPAASAAGAVYIYVKAAGTWTLQQKIWATGVANDRGLSNNFGKSVSLYGDTVVIGSNNGYDATGNNNFAFAGSAYVYVQNNSVWSLEQKVVPSGNNARMLSDNFASNLKLYKNTLVSFSLGQAYDEFGNNPVSTSGAVFVFNRQGTAWAQSQKIVPTGTNARTANAAFGTDIAIDDNYLFLSAPSHKFDSQGTELAGTGAVYVFGKDEFSKWTQLQRILPDIETATVMSGQNFGRSLSFDGTTLAVGAPTAYNDELDENSLAQAGRVYLFKKSSIGFWTKSKIISAQGSELSRNAGDQFGRAVIVDGDRCFVGAPQHDYDNSGVSMTDTGAVFIAQ